MGQQNSEPTFLEYITSKMETVQKYIPQCPAVCVRSGGLWECTVTNRTKRRFLIAGWSDKVFDVLQALEEGQTMLGTIEQITL